MYKIVIGLLSLLFSLTYTSYCYSWDSYREFNHSMGRSDYNTEVHLAGGGLVSALTIYYLPKDIYPTYKFIIGTGAGLLAGCISESLDKNWDNKDLAQWGIGGAMGAHLILLEF